MAVTAENLARRYEENVGRSSLSKNFTRVDSSRYRHNATGLLYVAVVEEDGSTGMYPDATAWDHVRPVEVVIRRRSQNNFVESSWATYFGAFIFMFPWGFVWVFIEALVRAHGEGAEGYKGEFKRVAMAYLVLFSLLAVLALVVSAAIHS